MSSHISILLILIAVNNAKAIDYSSYRINDTVSINVTRDTARTTREILEKLNNIEIKSGESLQEGTEHLLQFGALLRTNILDTFGKLIYDHYDEFNVNEMNALYQIYQDTMERKYNLFDIVPNVLINGDLSPLAICNYINLHVKSCLREISWHCTKTKFPKFHELKNDTNIIDLAKSIYLTAQIDEKFKNGITLSAILEFLQNNYLQFTVELFSGLLHNIQYDDYDDSVRTAERKLIHYFIKNSQYELRKYLLNSNDIKQYDSITKLLKGFLQLYQFPNHVRRHAEYLSEHILQEPNALDENIELLGAAYDDNNLNLKYLFELVLPDDTIDNDIIDAKNYLIDQMLKQNIVEKYLKIEKYQQSNPSFLLMGILGQLRDINFINDIATSLHLHARFWHKSHMIENLNQLLELFDAYENLRGIPDFNRFISTIDRLRTKLRNTNNATIEISCTNPRNCLRIALKIISKCNGMDRETKKLINRFIDKSNLQCPYQKHSDKLLKLPDKHEVVSKKPVITTTRKNLKQTVQQPDNSEKISASTFNSIIINQTTESPIIPTTILIGSNISCAVNEACDEDNILSTGGIETDSTNIPNELNATTELIDVSPEFNITSTDNLNLDVTTKLPEIDNLLETTLNSTNDICNSLECQNNINKTSDTITIPTTTSSDTDTDVSDSQTKRENYSDTESPLALLSTTVRTPVTKISMSPESLLTESEQIVTTPRPICQHHDIHYRQRLRRIKKIHKLNNKNNHRDNVKILQTFDTIDSTTSINSDKGFGLSLNNSSSNNDENSPTEIKTQSDGGLIDLLLNNKENVKSETTEYNEEPSHGGSIGIKKLNDGENYNGMDGQYQMNYGKSINVGSRSRNHNANQNINLDSNSSSKRKIINGGLHSKHVVKEAESQSQSSGHIEASSSSSSASTSEHRHKISQKFHQSSRRKSHNSHRVKSKKNNIETTLISDTVPKNNEKNSKQQNDDDKDDELSTTEDIIEGLKNKNDSEAKTRLFDWNMPLFSNYDVAMNDKASENKINYRSRRNIEEKLYSDANVRLYDNNIEVDPNIDVNSYDKLLVDKNNYRSRRAANITTTTTTTTTATTPTTNLHINNTLSSTTIRNVNDNSSATEKINATTAVK